MTQTRKAHPGEVPRRRGPSVLRTWMTAMVALLSLVAAGCDTGAKVHGWIAFRSGSEIVAVDPTEPKDRLALGSSHGDDPIAWSSDGTKLLLRPEDPFHTCIVPCGTVVLRVLHSGSTTTLLRHGAHLAPPTWGSFSPDGTNVVYATDGSSRGPYLIDADGGDPRALADRCPRQEVEGRGLVEFCGEPAPEAAAWSPDGSRIAWFDFAEGTIPDAGHEDFLSFVNPDGRGLREGFARLPGTFGAYSLVWSPEGSRLAFWQAEALDRPGQIFVINADGSGLQQITHEGDNRWPAWSPDGSRIAFVHNGTLFTMSPDGTRMRAVKGVMPDGAIAWTGSREI